MAICILLVCFAVTFLSLNILQGQESSKREVLISAVLVLSVFTVIITEVLSYFNAIRFDHVLLSWAIVTFINIVFIYINKKTTVKYLVSIKNRSLAIYRSLTGSEKFWLSATGVILLLVLAQGIIYPPNNWDSLDYHLGRITSWVSHGSIEHFPTHIFYQVYQPPFAEYVIMHFGLLARNDYFSAGVQLCFLLFVLVTLTLIIKKLGLPRRYQVLAIAFSALIPEVLLQASSTQNNIVESFFVITAYYFTLRAVDENKFKNYFLLGIAVGIAFLTKATAYIYLLPVLIFFGVNVLVKAFGKRNFKSLWYAAMVLFIALAINFRQYQRNYNLDGNIFGTPQEEMNTYTNAKMNPLLLLSNLVKNAGLHMATMGSVKPGVLSDTVIHKLNEMAGINVNSSDNNFANAAYHVPNGGANHEDAAPNPIHFLLLIIAFALTVFHFFKNRRNALAMQLLCIVLLQAIVFCWVLKWQPWNTRMHVQFFLLSAPLFCYAVSISGVLRKISYAAMPVILLYGFVLVLHNSTRPYLVITNQKPYLSMAPVFESRYEKYFANKPELYPEYKAVNDAIKTANYTNIGLIIGYNDWQYPLFTDCYSKHINPIHLLVHNASKSIANVFTDVNCIVSTTINKPFIDYKGKRFYNTDAKNKYIHLYK